MKKEGSTPEKLRGQSKQLKKEEEEMNETRSSEKTNTEIVKSLIGMMQSFTTMSDPEAQFKITISEDNLVDRYAMLIRVHQRQQDRIGDIADGIAKIVRGE